MKNRSMLYQGNILLFFASFTCFIFGSCQMTGILDETRLTSDSVDLVSFFPNDGAFRDKITLTGSGFGTDATEIAVFFNNSRSMIYSISNEELVVEVPRFPGDSCIITVIRGNDSSFYTTTFQYHFDVLTSTLTGNGTTALLPGSLDQAQVYARYLCIDSNDNLFASVRDAGNFAVVKISEQENMVTPLIWNTTPADLNPNGGVIHPTSGVLYIPHDGNKFTYYTFNSAEAYTPKDRPMLFDYGGLAGYTGSYKYVMAYCAYDGYLYTRLNSGEIVKIHPETSVSKVVFRAGVNAGYGMAFHPQKPYLLYLSMHSGTSLMNGIYTLDIRDPYALGAFNRITSTSTDPGHQDGQVMEARFNSPRQLAFDGEGNLYIADFGNHCIRMINNIGEVKTIAGEAGVPGFHDGDGENAMFENPWGITVSKNGTVYVSDYGNARIRKLQIN